MFIKGKDITYSYDLFNADYAIRNVRLSIAKGEFVCILGCNGSGKSTLARHLNALLRLQYGELSVAAIDVTDEDDIWLLRRICAMVFQNPENQFVSSVVEEDIAFGLENYEVPREMIPQMVSEALQLVDMPGFEKANPHALSGGQKQRIALAGVLVLDPKIIIFDETTAMLDPPGRQEVLELANKLHGTGKTIIFITHYIEEAVSADTIILMHQGEIVSTGKPRDILTNIQLLSKAEMMPPMPVRVYYDLLESGIQLDSCPLTNEELAGMICKSQLKT